MKVFFDTNVYVAEALLGAAAERMLAATQAASWRVFISQQVLNEIRSVLIDQLGFSRRLAGLAWRRSARRAQFVEPSASRHAVPSDPQDSPILRAALSANADYLVTNDRHLLALDPVEGLRIISMADYHQLLVQEGLL